MNGQRCSCRSKLKSTRKYATQVPSNSTHVSVFRLPIHHIQQEGVMRVKWDHSSVHSVTDAWEGGVSVVGLFFLRHFSGVFSDKFWTLQP